MSGNDSIGKTLTVALLLCIVCSIIVSTAAVVLKPAQETNQELDKRRNILAAAGMLDESKSVEEQFKRITTRMVDLRTGRFTDDVDPEGYNQFKAAKNPQMSQPLSPDEDIANISRRETPGLGGEVDNPRWKAEWPGKKVYRDGEVELGLVKGAVDPSSPKAEWQVDGLSGATLTARGVTNLVQFWLGENGFEPFLDKLKMGEA